MGTERRRGWVGDNSSPLERLRQKYSDLCQKYLALVERYEGAKLEKRGVFQLGWWGLNTSLTALALVRGGVIRVANPRWYELDRGDGPSCKWRSLSQARPRIYGNFRLLTLGEAARAVDQGVTATRFSAAGAQVFDVRAELRTVQGDPLVAILVHDITVSSAGELAGAREEPIRNQRLHVLGQLSAGLAHDLTNTLGAISLRLAVLTEDANCMRVHGDNIGALQQIVSTAGKTVANLQDFARHGSTTLTPMDLRAAIDEAVELVAAEHVPRRSTVTKSIPTLPMVKGDTAEVVYLFTNLLLNAQQAMTGEGTISIAAAVGDWHVRVTVADQGPGIDKEHLGRIFEPFFTTKSDKGTGLGLWLAYLTMQRLGGAISADNRQEGGAVFTLDFPIWDTPKRVTSLNSVATPPRRRLKSSPTESRGDPSSRAGSPAVRAGPGARRRGRAPRS